METYDFTLQPFELFSPKQTDILPLLLMAHADMGGFD